MRLIRCLPVLAGIALLGLGCSDDGGAGAEPLDASDATAVLDSGATTTSTSLQPVGDPVSRFSMHVGDCFNQYESIDVTSLVTCDIPHHREVFHTESHPAPFGEQWPGDLQMQRDALDRCYAQFETFAGTLYELSRLEIGVITPTEENFTDSKARYRGITCFVHDADGDDLVGSMRGKGE